MWGEGLGGRPGPRMRGKLTARGGASVAVRVKWVKWGRHAEHRVGRMLFFGSKPKCAHKRVFGSSWADRDALETARLEAEAARDEGAEYRDGPELLLGGEHEGGVAYAEGGHAHEGHQQRLLIDARRLAWRVAPFLLCARCDCAFAACCVCCACMQAAYV